MALGKRPRLECLGVHTSSAHSLGVHPLGDTFLPHQTEECHFLQRSNSSSWTECIKRSPGLSFSLSGAEEPGQLPPGQRQDQGSLVQPSLQPPSVPLREIFLNYRQNRDCKAHTGCVGVGKWGQGSWLRYPRLVTSGGQGTEAEIVSLRKQDS